MLQLGREQGYNFTAGAIKSALQISRRAWFERSIPHVDSPTLPFWQAQNWVDFDTLTGWVPIRVYWQQDHPWVDWCYLGDLRFTDSYFDQTISHRLTHPFYLLFRRQTTLEALTEWQVRQPGLPPTGFIFHTSRCGSTLIARLLASLPQNLVISEAGPIDTVLRANFYRPTITTDERLVWLRGLISALGQPRAGEQHFFIKFDSWSIFDLPLIRQAYPEVPWIFVYRHPVEVIVSQMRSRGMQMVPGQLDPALFNLDFQTLIQLPPEDYVARVLGKICEAACQQFPHYPGLLLNYSQLPEAIWTILPDFYKIQFTPTDLNNLRTTARFDAKSPTLYFRDDILDKQQQASELIRRLAEQWVMPWYEQLEAARQAPATR